jgi:hypothetical protein
MNTLHTQGAAPARAWTDIGNDYWDAEARSYGPDTDDGDGETDYLDALREELDALPEPPQWSEPFAGDHANLFGFGPDDEDAADDEKTPLEIVKPMPGPAEPYDAADTAGPWLTLCQHEQLDVLAAIPGVEVRGASVWVPRENLPEAWLSITESMAAWETVFVPGVWFSFAA